MKKRALSFLLALVMVVSTMVTASIMVVAADHEAGDVVDNTPSTVTPSDATNTSLFTGTPDFSWFEVENTGTDVSPSYAVVAPENNTYVLESADAFVGFRYLSNGHGKGNCDGTLVDMPAQNFDNYTVKLDVNVIINVGDASTWSKTNRTGLHMWQPIGAVVGNAFKGTFDGGYHYISGVYSNADWATMKTAGTAANSGTNGRDNGFFGWTNGAVIKNFVLTNSLFVNTASSSYQGVGVVHRLQYGSLMENVYSDAHMTGLWGCGGLVGFMNNNDGSAQVSTLKNCIFAGKIELPANNSGAFGAFVGCPEHAVQVVQDCLSMGAVVQGARKNYTASVMSDIPLIGTGKTANASVTNSIRIVESEEIETASFDDSNWEIAIINGKERLVPKGPKKPDGSWDIGPWEMYTKWFESGSTAVVADGYNGTPTYDWYVDSVDADGVVTKAEPNAKGQYVIDSASDLYGFSYLSNGIAKIGDVTVAAQTFDDDKIVLGADITVNGGDASYWTYANQPTYEWIPVGHQQGTWGSGTARSFRGTFDGQGYTISGLFSDTYWSNTKLAYKSPVGSGNHGANGSFICHAYDATITNFSLVNSAFVSGAGVLGGNSQGFGTIEKADGGTRISNIYSEVILQGGYGVGGIVGFARAGAYVDNCVWAGEIKAATGSGVLIGGIVGAFDGTDTTRVVSNCLSIGTITYSQNTGNSATPTIGGIGGNASYGVTITNCISANKMDNATKATYGAIIGSAYRTASDPATGPKVYSWAILENVVYDSSLLPTGAVGVLGIGDTFTTNGNLTAGGDTAADRSDDVYEQLTFATTPVADLASFDASEWSGWTDLVADIPVPTAAWALAQKTFDDVKLAFVQETDVTTIEHADGNYEGYTVRLAAEIFNLEATEAGFEIKVGDNWLKLGSSTTVYKSLNAKGADGEIGQVKADYGKYFTALEVNVASGELVSFTVRPYIVIEGKTTYGTAYTITYDAEGAFVSAVAAN